jgi:hypothetical protein
VVVFPEQTTVFFLSFSPNPKPFSKAHVSQVLAPVEGWESHIAGIGSCPLKYKRRNVDRSMQTSGDFTVQVSYRPAFVFLK